MKEFSCSCVGCGKKPEFGLTEIWIESERGMLCEACWRAAVHECMPLKKDRTFEGDFCCFCVLCKRMPPDPNYKMWVETEKGCLCEKCWKETICSLLAERIESAAIEKKAEKLEPLDVQLGCCVLNKKLLSKALDELSKGKHLEISVDGTEAMKSLVKKYVETRGDVITDINDKNGTTIITITRHQ